MAQDLSNLHTYLHDFAIHRVYCVQSHARMQYGITVHYELHGAIMSYTMYHDMLPHVTNSISLAKAFAQEIYEWLKNMNRTWMLNRSEEQLKEYFNQIWCEVAPKILPKTYSNTPDPTPPKPKLDEDVQEAIDLADEAMQLQKEIIEKTERFQQKVKAHKKKHGSILDIFK